MDGDARQLTTPTTFILALTPSAFCSGHSGRPALRASTYFAGCSGFRYGPSTFWRTLEIRSAGSISSNRAISPFASSSRPASAQLAAPMRSARGYSAALAIPSLPMIALHHNVQQRNEHAQSHKGDLDRAIPFLERSLSLSAAANIMGYARQCRINLGHAYVLARRAGEGLDALKLAAEQGLSRTSRVHACLSVAHMALGNAEEAHRLAVSAQCVARANQERPNEAFALHVL